MKSILIIDDDWDDPHKGKNLYMRSPDFSGYELQGFTSILEARQFLETLPKDKLPSLCVIDAIGGHGPFVDTEFGSRNAAQLETLFHGRGHSVERYLFKSADLNKADKAVDTFRITRPDSASGTVSERNGYQHWGINTKGYKPVDVPELAKEFLRQTAIAPRYSIYETLRAGISPLHATWDDLDQVKGKEDCNAYDFSFGAGRARNGIIVHSLADLKDLPKSEKGILVCDVIPEDLMQYKERLSGIVMLKGSHIPGHIRLILKPYDISLLIGSNKPFDLGKYAPVTVDPNDKKLYTKKLEIISIEASMPRVLEAVDAMNEEANQLLRRSSAIMPQFVVNVSSSQDYRTYGRDLGVGLTRSEHFFSPFVAPKQFDRVKDFLIGNGVKLRRIFAAAERQGNEIPYVAAKRDTYQNNYRLAVPLVDVVGSYCSNDVLRLCDIPPEEFFKPDDLTAFERLYGKNTRGVQLAKQVPDLYINQLRFLMGFGSAHEGLPVILIPAVKTADDIDFVKQCAQKAWPRACAATLELGAMIETQEACQNITAIAKKVNVISIGSNDLTSEIEGVSRQDPEAIPMFKSLTPKVLKAIKTLVSEAREANPYIRISLCGEAASDLNSLMALRKAGVVIDSFSVPSTFKDAKLLPLLYKDTVLQDFSGPSPEIYAYN